MAKKPTYEELEQRVKELEEEAAEHKRAEENIQLQSQVAENMAEGVYLIRTSDGTIVYANKTFEGMFGYDPGELVNKHVSTVNAPTEKSPQEIADEIIQSLKEKGGWRGEVKNIKKDGTPFWCHANVSTFDHHDFGEAWVAVHEDITDRKLAEEKIKASLKEKEVLLREVHHRVKNNFQIISSLLDMIKMRTQNQEAIDLLTGARSKIYTMALVHTQLYEQERFDRVDMGSHIRKLVDYLSQTYGGRGKSIHTMIEPSDVYLTLNQAIPCALVLSEIISNAFKHAFAETQKGTIEISAQRSADNTIFISVEDDGMGIPEEIDIYKANSLGLKLIRNIVEEQLMGKVQVERNQGTTISIKFKALKEKARHV